VIQKRDMIGRSIGETTMRVPRVRLMARRVVAVATVAGLIWFIATGRWLPVALRDETGPFLRAVRVGMRQEELIRSQGSPDQRLSPGATLQSWGRCEPHVVDAETWVYFRNPVRTHRFAVLLTDGRVARIIHDKT
jgi:hypothetical protein